MIFIVSPGFFDRVLRMVAVLFLSLFFRLLQSPLAPGVKGSILLILRLKEKEAAGR